MEKQLPIFPTSPEPNRARSIVHSTMAIHSLLHLSKADERVGLSQPWIRRTETANGVNAPRSASR